MQPLHARRFLWLILVAFSLLLAACNPDEGEVVLPTRVSVGAEVTAEADVPTGTPAGNRPTLPPAWTATPFLTPTPLPPTPTEEILPTGRVFYLYNNDSIIAMNGDGTNTQFILTFGVGMVIEDMVISPDQSLLAFVAPGNGSAREVFVSNLDGTFVLQVSCLGFGEVHEPSWSPDSASLAFLAAPAAGAVPDVYRVNVSGSGNCPADNDQRRLFSTGSVVMGDVAWSPNGTHIFYSAPTIRAYNVDTGEISDELTETLGFGADYDLTFNPVNAAELAYIRPVGDFGGQSNAGRPFILNVAALTAGQFPIPLPGEAVDLSWGADGEYVIVSSEDSVLVAESETNSGRSVVSDPGVVGHAVYDHRREVVFYVALDPQNPAVEQIFSATRLGTDITPLTAHTEGTVSDLIWIAD